MEESHTIFRGLKTLGIPTMCEWVALELKYPLDLWHGLMKILFNTLKTVKYS